MARCSACADRTSPVKLDSLLQLDHLGYIALCFRFGVFLVGLVERRDVGVVMLAVVQLHYFSTDDWLKRAVVIRKVWQGLRRQAPACLHGT